MAKIDADIGPRAHALIVFGLTEVQWTALDKFNQPGGHGFGEYAYLPTPTAKALEARRLVKLGRRYYDGHRSMLWGEITPAGRALLNAVQREADAESDRSLAECRARSAEIERRIAGLQ